MEVKDAKQQETCRFSSQINFELKTRSFLSCLYIFCFLTEYIRSASLYIGPQILVERTTPEHFRKTTRTHFCSKSDQNSSFPIKTFGFYANRDSITTGLQTFSRQSIKTLG